MDSKPTNLDDDIAARIIELYVAKWLRESDEGQTILRAFAGTPLDQIIDHIFELLNLAFLKIIGDCHELTHIEVRMPPQPSRAKIRRARPLKGGFTTKPTSADLWFLQRDVS
jgi:hypothetical protein